MGWYMLLSSGIIMALLCMVVGMTFSLTKITSLAVRYPKLDCSGGLFMLRGLLIMAPAGLILLSLAICLQALILTLQSAQIEVMATAIIFAQSVGVFTAAAYYWRTARRHFTH